MIDPVEIFFSYSHKDENLRQELENHLSLLKRQGFISGWHDHKIMPGQQWKDEIDAHLTNASIILLLVSPDFLASDYCYGIELQKAMERHVRGEVHVVPIILRPVDWQKAPFGTLQALPVGSVPIMDRRWHTRDEAFYNVVQGIRAIIEQPDMSTAFPEKETLSVLAISSGRLEEISPLEVSPAIRDVVRSKDVFNLLHQIKGHQRMVSSVAISPNGQILVSGSVEEQPNLIKVWNPYTGRLIRTLSSEGKVAISSNGETLVSVDNGSDWFSDQIVRIWNLNNGELLQEFEIEKQERERVLQNLWHLNCFEEDIINSVESKIFRINVATLSPNGETIVGGGKDIRHVKIHTYHRYSRGGEKYPGKQVYNSFLDQSTVGMTRAIDIPTISTWNSYTGEETKGFIGHSDWVTSLEVSPDGQFLVSGSLDTTVKIWDFKALSSSGQKNLCEHLDM